MAKFKRRFKESGGNPDKVKEAPNQQRIWDEVSKRHKAFDDELKTFATDRYKKSI